jgi:hypothetical protein
MEFATLVKVGETLSEVLELDPPIKTDYEITEVTAKGAAGKAQAKKAEKQMAEASEPLTKELVDLISVPDEDGEFLVLDSDMSNLDDDLKAAIAEICPDQVERLGLAGEESAPSGKTDGSTVPKGKGKGKPGKPSKPKKAPKEKEPKKPSRGNLMTKVFLDGVTDRDKAVAAGDKAAVAAGWKSNESEAGFQFNKVREIFAAIEEHGYEVVKK